MSEIFTGKNYAILNAASKNAYFPINIRIYGENFFNQRIDPIMDENCAIMNLGEYLLTVKQRKFQQ